MLLFDVRIQLRFSSVDFITQKSPEFLSPRGSGAWKASLRAANSLYFQQKSSGLNSGDEITETLSGSLTGNRATFSLNWELTIIIIVIITMTAVIDQDQLGRTNVSSSSLSTHQTSSASQLIH